MSPSPTADPSLLLDATRPHFTLWCTRGSTPTPGARFLRAGGNTSCMSVAAGGDLFIFDAGSRAAHKAAVDQFFESNKLLAARRRSGNIGI